MIKTDANRNRIEEIRRALNDASVVFDDLAETLSAFFNALPDPIFVLDQQGTYIKVLGGHARELYQDSTGLEGNSIRDFFSEEATAQFLQAIDEAIEKQGLVCVEYQLTEDNFSGTNPEHTSPPQWYEGRVFPIKGPAGDPPTVVWYAINITEKKQMQQEMQRLAETDPLTGAYNRRYFSDRLARDFALSQRYDTPFCFLMMDVDHFKSINDRFGHDVGDQVLKQLVGLCAPLLRDVDLFARFGGEEFVVLLPNTELDGARTIAERIRMAIADSGLLSQSDSPSFTVSIGISAFSADDADVDALIKRADQAMYQAKEGGRNRVCCGASTL